MLQPVAVPHRGRGPVHTPDYVRYGSRIQKVRNKVAADEVSEVAGSGGLEAEFDGGEIGVIKAEDGGSDEVWAAAGPGFDLVAQVEGCAREGEEEAVGDVVFYHVDGGVVVDDGVVDPEAAVGVEESHEE